jgi:hypothetical protein
MGYFDPPGECFRPLFQGTRPALDWAIFCRRAISASDRSVLPLLLVLLLLLVVVVGVALPFCKLVAMLEDTLTSTSSSLEVLGSTETFRSTVSSAKGGCCPVAMEGAAAPEAALRDHCLQFILISCWNVCGICVRGIKLEPVWLLTRGAERPP